MIVLAGNDYYDTHIECQAIKLCLDDNALCYLCFNELGLRNS